VRQRQLDGIRAIAILSVIALHHFLFPVGWAGVDLFFVLSGFLITRILIQTRNKPGYWTKFYIKRAGRILPPLMILFPATLALSHHIKPLGLLGYVLFLGDYVNITSYSSGLLICLWSLAIEEHFYMIWPFTVRYLTRKHMAQVLIAVLVLEPVLRVIATHFVATYEPIYYLTFFRLDSIAAGSLLAVLIAHPKANTLLKSWSLTLCLIAIALWTILASIFGSQFDKNTNSMLFNGLGYSLVTLASFGVVAHVLVKEDGWLAKILSIRPLTFIGEISYGMYLFHPMIEATLRKLSHTGFGAASAAGTRKLFLIALPLTIAFCWVSFKLFESPIVKWSKHKAKELGRQQIDPGLEHKSNLILQ